MNMLTNKYLFVKVVQNDVNIAAEVLVTLSKFLK